MLFSKQLHTIVMLQRFRVQRSGLKNSQPALTKEFCLHRFYNAFFTQWVMSGTPNLDQYSWQFPTVVTSEP
jgi:hypothetical protein